MRGDSYIRFHSYPPAGRKGKLIRKENGDDIVAG